MTFLEKAMEIDGIKGKQRTRTEIIQGSCPSEYGLEPIEKSDNCTVSKVGDCQKCWNREMPNTELVKTVTLPMPPNTEPKEDKPFTEKEVYEEAGYNKGLNDAWELAKQILYGNNKQIIEIFDVEVEPRFFDLTHKREIINNYTPQRVKAKVDEWRESKNIEVGDVVRLENGNIICVTITKKGLICGIDDHGRAYHAVDIKTYKKTGKHIDIKSILEQIGE